jgi:hypothetical protein
MNENAKAIISMLAEYLDKHPESRFGQALFNLNVNQFEDQQDPSRKDFLLRDIYNDSDVKVLKRMKAD